LHHDHPYSALYRPNLSGDASISGTPFNLVIPDNVSNVLTQPSQGVNVRVSPLKGQRPCQ
jgi:hypothetical protein